MFVISRNTAPQYPPELIRCCYDTQLQSSVCGYFVVSHTWLYITDEAFSSVFDRASCLECTAIISHQLLFQSHVVKTFTGFLHVNVSVFFCN